MFFAIFLVSSLAIPSPLFPGNIVCFLLKIADVRQFSVVSAVANGVFYGFIAWFVFSVSFKWIERSLSKSKLPRKKE